MLTANLQKLVKVKPWGGLYPNYLYGEFIELGRQTTKEEKEVLKSNGFNFAGGKWWRKIDR